MDAAAFEQVYGSFRDFQVWPPGTREHSGHYLQGPAGRSGERRNAENLSETVPGSARGMQRFLTDSPWDDEVIIGRLQEYLGTRLEQPEGVWVWTAATFPSRGGSRWEWPGNCGRLGKVANCQAGMFLAYVSPLGRALVDKGLYLPESWTSDKDRCEAAGVPEDRQGYRSKTELALEQERGEGWMGRGGRRLWDVAVLPGGPGGLGDVVRAGRSVRLYGWPPEPAWTSAEYQGFGRPRKPRLRDGQRRTMEQRSDELPEEAWRLRWPREARGHAATFSAPRGCDRPAWRNPLGRLPPEPGRQRTPLLPVQCSGGYPVGDPGIRGRLPLAYRNGV